jgi:transposase, IS5 family
MWREQRRQRSLAEQLISAQAGRNRRLQRIDELIEWAAVESQLSAIYAAGEGRPAYRPLVLFKALLLAQWYQLSDPGLEEALSDRLSFRRFVGLALEEEVPDHSTLSRFRAQLARRGLGEQLLETINQQLERRGLIIKRGTILDATLVDAAVNPPQGPKGVVKPGTPSPLDPEAQWRGGKNKSGGHTEGRFGYKAHLAVDEGSELIRKAVFTGAKVNDTEMGDRLICGDEGRVIADKGYDSKARRALLARLGVADCIMRRAPWGRARNPPRALAQRNHRLRKIRYPVERKFAVLKRWYGYRRVRYRGLLRNRLHLQLLCVALNLRRALVLSAA